VRTLGGTGALPGGSRNRTAVPRSPGRRPADPLVPRDWAAPTPRQEMGESNAQLEKAEAASLKPAVAGALALAAALAALKYRRGPILGFDQYYYCELAKQFASSWPDRFGNAWPFGYPMAGALLGRLGLPAFESLVAASAACLLVLLATSAMVLRGRPLGWLAVLALAACPVISTQLGGLGSELPFSAAFMALMVCLALWPARGAVWAAPLCALLGFGFRYASLIGFPVLGVWIIRHWAGLQSARRLGEAVLATGLAAAAAGCLLACNAMVSGHMSGMDRGSGSGLHSLPIELSQLGWSVPSAIAGGWWRFEVGIRTAPGRLLGGLFCGAMLGLCLWAWLRPRSRYSRPLALGATSYMLGMAVLHCVGGFDSLDNPRTFLPAFAPLLLLAVERLGARRLLIGAGCGALLGLGIAASLRGISRQIGGDVRAAVEPLRGRIGPADRIAINDDAFSISAYFPQATDRVYEAFWDGRNTDRFLVLCAKPVDRFGASAGLSPLWTRIVSDEVARGGYRYILQTRSVVVAERASAP